MLFKSKKKHLITPVLAILASAAISFMASAETTNNVTLDISTDKQSYSSGEQVSVTVSAFNGTEKDLKNVIITESVPSGFDLVGRHSLTLNNPVLSAGSSLQDNYIIVPTAGAGSGSQSADDAASHTTGTNSPRISSTVAPAATANTQAEDVSAGEGLDGDGDTLVVNTGKFAVVFLISLAVILSITLLAKDKKALKKILSLFTAMFIIVPFCADMGTVKVSAESGNISTSATFNYSGRDYTVSVVMKYDEDANELVLDPDNEPIIDIPKYVMNLNHVQTEPQTGIKYIDNEIVVTFANGYSREMVDEVANYLDATIVDSEPCVDEYEFRLNNIMTLDETTALCNAIESQYSFIELAAPTYVHENDDILNAYAAPVNDPWDNFLLDWDEELPNGDNWWIEYINGISAWKYNNRLIPIRIGVVDTEFGKNPDLDYNFLDSRYNESIFTADTKNYHGTHVAGIIGAGYNNEKGITGLVENADLYLYDYSGNLVKENKITDCVARAVIEDSCKIINLSCGKNWYKLGVSEESASSSLIWQTLLLQTAKDAETKVLKMLNEKKDFIIVQSAGNDGFTNAHLNGYFASIIDTDVNSYCDLYSDHIILVGSTEKDGTISTFSNQNADIYAPGSNIISLGYDGYNIECVKPLSGTSMSAPIVSAVCAMVWGADETLSSAEVKKIALENYNKSVTEKTGDVKPIANAELAVEKALGIDSSSQNSVNAKIKVVDQRNNTPLSGATVTLSLDGKDIYVSDVTTNDGIATIPNIELGRFNVTNDPTKQNYDYYDISIDCLPLYYTLEDKIYFENKQYDDDVEVTYELEFIVLGDDENNIVDSGTCGDNLTWTLTDDGTLTISGTGEMDDYREGNYFNTNKIKCTPWFHNKSLIQTIIIEEGLNRIGNHAFKDCRNLTSVAIPNSVNSIGEESFYGCTNLVSLTIPGNVIVIEYAAFYNCENLTSISIPKNLTEISPETFFGCYKLNTIYIPYGVTVIGPLAFWGCNFTTIEIPDSVTSIKDSAFDNCTNLTIYGKPDSYAQYYANEKGIPFIEITN